MEGIPRYFPIKRKRVEEKESGENTIDRLSCFTCSCLESLYSCICYWKRKKLCHPLRPQYVVCSLCFGHFKSRHRPACQVTSCCLTAPKFISFALNHAVYLSSLLCGPSLSCPGPWLFPHCGIPPVGSSSRPLVEKVSKPRVSSWLPHVSRCRGSIKAGICPLLLLLADSTPFCCQGEQDHTWYLLVALVSHWQLSYAYTLVNGGSL